MREMRRYPNQSTVTIAYLDLYDYLEKSILIFFIFSA